MRQPPWRSIAYTGAFLADLPTVVAEYRQWLLIEKGRAPATVEAYESDLACFFKWWGAKPIRNISEADLTSFLAHERRDGLSSASLARRTASLRGFLSFLATEGILAHDPSLTLGGGRRARHLPKPIPEADVLHLLDSIDGDEAASLRDRAILELLYGTGARVSEATGVSLGDIDFDEELILLTGKGSKQRLVPVGRSLRQALRAYLGVGGRPSLVRPQKSSDRLFLNARGGPLTRQGIDLIIGKRALEAGIESQGLSAHSFRHSCATHMLAHGADIRVVQELLGHASIATTQVYTAVSVDSLRSDYLNAHPRARG